MVLVQEVGVEPTGSPAWIRARHRWRFLHKDPQNRILFLISSFQGPVFHQLFFYVMLPSLNMVSTMASYFTMGTLNRTFKDAFITFSRTPFELIAIVSVPHLFLFFACLLIFFLNRLHPLLFHFLLPSMRQLPAIVNVWILLLHGLLGIVIIQ